MMEIIIEEEGEEDKKCQHKYGEYQETGNNWFERRCGCGKIVRKKIVEHSIHDTVETMRKF